MDIITAKRRVEVLKTVLRENSRRYYVDNNPSITDFEYDAMMRELEDLERAYPQLLTPDSPTQKVGSDIEMPFGRNAESQTRTGFVQRAHKYPMLSLGNTYSIAEIEEFASRADKILGAGFTYCCELKFDGTAIALTYRKGKLVQALTRGDGEFGDDVTQNVLHIKNIPHTLKGDFPEELEIRGEILMPYDAFDALNQEREDNEEQPFANPRNAASGSLKLTDPEEVGRRGLCCTLYHIPTQSIEFNTHDEALERASSWGLPVSDNRELCNNMEDIREYIEKWDIRRKLLPFATDGIVIKINELQAQRELGYTAKSPRWAVAYKFKAEQALTELLSIDYQVGRTGAVTPVANLSPIQLSGTTVKRATLNNEGQMALLDIRVGDSVYVEKGGEIIPKITGVEKSRRHEGTPKPEFPKLCPECGTPLIKAEDEAKWFCPNSDGCPTQIKGRILHFVGRKAMDILAGDATVGQLYDAALVRMPSDLYSLGVYDMMGLEGWQEKSSIRFLESVRNSLEVPFERVLFALGIRYVGVTTAKALSLHFGNMDKIASASMEELLEVGDVGERIAKSIHDFFRKDSNVSEVQRLRQAGLQFSAAQPFIRESAVLEGKTIVVSGNFSISRDAMKNLIESHGGKCSSSVSGKTSFLLAGTKPGPEKISKCESLGIMVLTEDAFRALLPQKKDPEAFPEQLSLFQ